MSGAERADASSQLQIELEQLQALEPVRRLPGRNRTKADILVYRCRGVEIAVKDYGRLPLLVRNTVGRYFARREAAAYRAARGIPGLPRFLGRIGPFALATEWIEARPLADFLDTSPRRGGLERALDGVGAIVDELHKRGIALADLHHRDVLVGTDGSGHVVDLATAWVLGKRPGRWRRRLFQRLSRQDDVALARMRARLRDEDPDVALAALGKDAATWHRRGRRLKKLISLLRGRRG